jgi:hypothetical protein
MLAGKALRKTVRLGVDDIVHITLPVEGDVLGAVPGGRCEPHQTEHAVQFGGIGMGEFDELHAVRPHRVGIGDGGWRGIEREGTHGVALLKN